MQPRELAQLLVDQKLIDRKASASALSSCRPQEPLADWLVARGHVKEADLLRALAQAHDVRFVSSSRLANLRVAQDVLDRIPLQAAQRYDALPIGFDPAQKTLTVVMADPAQLPELDNLPDVARAHHVAVVVALPSVIRASVQRLYGQRRPDDPIPLTKVAQPPAGHCPNCQTPFFEEQLECGHCGLLLDANAPVDHSHKSIVRALLERPAADQPAPARATSHDAPTRLGFVVPMTDDAVPEISGNLDIVRSLAELEAFLLTWVDGEVSVATLSKLSGLMGVEVRSIVASLVERGVLKFRALGPAAGRGAPLTTQPIEGVRESADAWLARALAHERKGDLDGAIEVLREAITHAASPAPLYNRLAVLLVNRERDADQAQELLRYAIALEPENPVYQQNLLKIQTLQS